MTDAQNQPGQTRGRSVPWQGLNHLALITDDMDTTTRFWHGVLDAPLIATIGTGSFRHYFFDVGNGSVAFFEYGEGSTTTIAKPAGVFDPRAGHFDHLSLDVPDQAALDSLRARLEDWGTEVSDTIDHGLMVSIYFTDPNGIALEASWWKSRPRVGDEAALADPDPVPAVRELLESGTVSHVPVTTLVDEPTTGSVVDQWWVD